MSDEHTAPSFIISTRFLLAVLIFLGISIQYAHKSDISVAIVCMVNHTAAGNESAANETASFTYFSNDRIESTQCKFQNTSSGKDPDGPFVWSKDVQGFILSSYFYGYITSQIVGGWASYRFGPKIVFLISMFVGSIGTLLVPVCSKWSYIALIVCRFFTGAAQGTMWPTMMYTWARWAPTHERSRLIGVGNSGSQIGTIIGFSYGGYLCTNGFDGGWPSIFYIFGSFGLAWCIAWFFLTADSPDKHRFIKDKEKNYIINNVTLSNRADKTPWKKIITSKACIVLFIAHFSQAWGVILFLTNAPTYMKEVLKFDIKSNGLLSSIPYVSVLVVILVSSIMSDKLIKSAKISRCNIRRIFNTVGLILPSFALAGLAYVECDKPYLGVALLTIGIALTGFANGGGFLVTFNDIAGSYSGVVFGISNTFATLTGIFVPYLVAAITKNHLQSEWRVIFLLTAGIYTIGGIITVIFGSSELQDWAKTVEYEHIPNEEEE